MSNYFNNGSGALAATGVGGVTVGGVFFQELWLLVFAVALVALGAAFTRVAWRRGKTVGSR